LLLVGPTNKLYVVSVVIPLVIFHADASKMAYNRLLKMNLLLLMLVVIGIVASLFALYAGNKKFIGILGIALFALSLVIWRIFSLTRNVVPGQKEVDINLDSDLLQWIRPPQK
jgi:hypothetical protein